MFCFVCSSYSSHVANWLSSSEKKRCIMAAIRYSARTLSFPQYSILLLHLLDNTCVLSSSLIEFRLMKAFSIKLRQKEFKKKKKKNLHVQTVCSLYMPIFLLSSFGLVSIFHYLAHYNSTFLISFLFSCSSFTILSSTSIQCSHHFHLPSKSNKVQANDSLSVMFCGVVLLAHNLICDTQQAKTG